MTTPDLIIHAVNAVGLGASLVAQRIVRACEDAVSCGIRVLVPATWDRSSVLGHPDDTKWIASPKPRINSWARTCDCLGFNVGSDQDAPWFILGDMPIRGPRRQVVLVHQPHLISPTVDALVSRNLNLRASRCLFGLNAAFPRRFIVQSDHMRTGLERSYPTTKGRIEVAPHPPPRLTFAEAAAWTGSKPYYPDGDLELIYPAAAYPHKNHAILIRWLRGDIQRVRLHLTMSDSAYQSSGFSAATSCNTPPKPHDLPTGIFARAHALVFPSLQESYGLPLIEAMMLGLPIVAADLPYARWACADQALYFPPHDPAGLDAAVNRLRERLATGWRPDWTATLAKVHRDWSGIVGLMRDAILRD